MRFNCLLTLLPPLLLAEIGYVEPWGKDSALCAIDHSAHREKPLSPLSPLGQLAEKLILFHQTSLTHTTGPRSHFRPSSSHYALEAIRKHGFFKGYLMGCDRLMRENADPWLYRTSVVDEILYKWDPAP